MGHYDDQREREVIAKTKSGKNIWKDFAKLNGMTPEEFLSEITLATIVVMSMKLDEQDSNAIKITQGQYTLMLIDNNKER